MGQESRAGKFDTLVEESVSKSVDEMVIVTSQISTIEAVIESLNTSDEIPHQIKLITDRDTLKAADSNFIISSRLNQYFEEGVLNIRSHPGDHPTALFVKSDEVTFVHETTADEGILMSSGDEDVVIAVREKYISQWKNGRRFQLSKPSYARMLESIGQDLGESMQESIQSVFESAGLTSRDGEQLDEVYVYLLMAARNKQQFYDLCSWGEDMGVASRAKFSKQKRALEEAGLIETEKVPTDVGRPRQRLVLAKDSLKNASSAEIVQVSQSVL